jgi:hypothetical protein
MGNWLTIRFRGNQKGFAVLEGFLILVIIAVISGIGWYAIHTKHQTDKILSQADKISQSTPTKQNTSISNNWILYENIDFGFKFSYPKKWNQSNIKDFIQVDLANGFTEYLGCGYPECAVKYDTTDGQWHDSKGAKSAEVTVFAKSGNFTAFAAPLRGDMNCGAEGISIPYQGNMIHMTLGMCTRPTSSNDHQPPSGSLIYEEEALNMKKVLDSLTSL